MKKCIKFITTGRFILSAAYARSPRPLAAALAMVWSACSNAAETQLAEVEISAQAEPTRSSTTLQAAGLPTSVTVIGREEIERTTIGGDYTDLLRRVPGISAYSFGQGDIGSPVKMRGFTGTGAHGGDVAIYVDGVPQNLPSANQGGPGMSDLSWLTADMIERIEVIKGPFSALYGDQNRAGAINIVTRGGGDSSIGASLGSYGEKRGTLVHGGTLGAVRSFVVAEVYDTEGYRDNSGLTRSNLFAKASLETSGAVWALRGNYYKSDWDAPGYLSYASLVAGSVSPGDRDVGSPPLWGKAERYGLVLTRSPARGEAGLHATAFAEHYDKSRANGVSGNTNAYNVQNDHRWIAGGRMLYHFAPSPRASLTLGGELRHDQGTGVNQRWDSTAGPGSNYVNNWDLDLTSAGVFAQGQYRVFDELKLVGGLRTERFDYRIDNRKLPTASLDYDQSVTTPRFGLVWSPLAELEFFANSGEGFRSPAERELSPAGSLGPLGAAGGSAYPDLEPPKVKARDFGVTTHLGQRLRLSASRYHTLNENEIRETTAGSGIYAGIGDTTRDGWELEANLYATAALNFYGSIGRVRGRVNNPSNPGQDLISGLPERSYRLGFDYTAPFAAGTVLVNGDAYHITGMPYYSGSNPVPLFSRPYTRYDLRLAYEQGRNRYTVYATFQPREYASEQAGATVDPRPRTDFGVAFLHKF